MPPAVQGVYLPGNELSLDGNLQLVGPLRLTGRAYRFENETLGESGAFGVEGGSLGLRVAKGNWRLDVRSYHRTADYSTRAVRRSGQFALGVSSGPWSLSTTSEVGRETTSNESHPSGSHRGELRLGTEAGYASVTVRSYESGGVVAPVRADFLGAGTVKGIEVAGGAWTTKGWTAGGEPGAWIQVGVPGSNELIAMVGVEHWENRTSPWRLSFGLQRSLIVPIPFVGGGGPSH